MPLLIAAVFAALVAFYVKTGDAPATGARDGDPESGASVASGASGVAGTAAGAGLSEELPDPPPVAGPAEPPATGPSGGGFETVSAGAEDGGVAGAPAFPPPLPREDWEARFTPWMSTTALDTYIRARNAGYSESFWKRGHWIPSVEGRWREGAPEFRIVIETMPSPDAWQWQYRINQTEPEFSRTAFELQVQGFRLLHHQVYLDGASARRVQAVWRRPAPPSEVVERGER